MRRRERRQKAQPHAGMMRPPRRALRFSNQVRGVIPRETITVCAATFFSRMRPAIRFASASPAAVPSGSSSASPKA